MKPIIGKSQWLIKGRRCARDGTPVPMVAYYRDVCYCPKCNFYREIIRKQTAACQKTKFKCDACHQTSCVRAGPLTEENCNVPADYRHPTPRRKPRVGRTGLSYVIPAAVHVDGGSGGPKPAA